ncbi:hypothetical protein GCM10023215_08010 [Pseudonocardia yuanmonensis]|uniref:DUF4389 domain-containing protein n=1 Tax=Pseudonocardia yuanmonensis TaxID=1095914 RepID=A0ABP8W2Q7_9PSEU
MTNSAYPVRVTGRLEGEPSRWLWLLKWLLLVPHLIVLAVLGLAFWVLTVVAFVAILVSGRYPRAIFGFNLGVLRWGWRVAYYGYAANGTDRYPPFTLADRADYPARLEIDHPERLSRGLVLVKWWLLALPHYLVLVFLIGAGGTVVWRVGTTGATGFDGGLVSVLVLFAVVALLFTGRYPRGLFDLTLGLDRWVLRVVAYAALMTDAYPPFRLDQGGDEPLPLPPPLPSGGPGEAAVPPAPQPPAVTPGAPPAAPRSGGAAVLDRPVGAGAPPAPPVAPARTTSVPPPSAGRSVLLVLGAVVTAIALGLTLAGFTGLVTDRVGRDAAGFIDSGVGTASTRGAALRTEQVLIDTGADTDAVARVAGEVALRATSRTGDVFVGIGPSAAVDRYLAGVAQGVWRGEAVAGTPRVVTRVDELGGGAPATPPAAQTFWVASASGPGTQTALWTPESGSWTAVVMNADGTAPVAADVQVGAQVPVLGATSAVALWTGLGLLAVGIGVIVAGARTRREQEAVR